MTKRHEDEMREYSKLQGEAREQDSVLEEVRGRLKELEQVSAVGCYSVRWQDQYMLVGWQCLCAKVRYPSFNPTPMLHC